MIDTRWRFQTLLLLLLFQIGAVYVSEADANPALSKGQTIFVPAYPQIYFGDTVKGGQKERNRRRVRFSSTLVIDNIDSIHPIQVTSADYFDHTGTSVRSFYPKPITLAPLESTNVFIQRSDKVDGVGNKFIITWKSKSPVNPPAIENIMVNASGTSFSAIIGQGRVVWSSGPTSPKESGDSH